MTKSGEGIALYFFYIRNYSNPPPVWFLNISVLSDFIFLLFSQRELRGVFSLRG